MSQAPGFRSEGSRETKPLLQAGPGTLSLQPGSVATSPRGSRQRMGGETSVPARRRHCSLGSHPGGQLGWEHLRLLCLEAWSPKHGPTGARQREEAGRASTEGL